MQNFSALNNCKTYVPAHIFNQNGGAEKNVNMPSDLDAFSPKLHSSLPSTQDYLKNYIGKGVKFIQSVSKKLTKEKVNEKINEVKLTKLFIDSGNSISDIAESKDLIKRLARLDYDNVAGKYQYYLDNIAKDVYPEFTKNNPKNIAYALELENLTPEGLKSLHKMETAKYREDQKWNKTARVDEIPLNVNYCAKNLKEYEEFDLMSTAEQTEYTRYFAYYISNDYVNSLSKNDDLMQFSLISDVQRCGSKENLQAELKERMKNKPISGIAVNEDYINDFVKGDDFSFENLKTTIGKTDLSKYEHGFPLKYQRKDFIADFNKAVENLKPQERKQVFDYYKFSIDSKNDIVKYPIPNDSDISDLPANVQAAIVATKDYVNDFIINNSFVLDEEDKGTEEVLNEFIKVFPEFISVAGKVQHRGDSIDFHTIEDLQLCLNNPETETLSKEEQRILFFSVMFHDISKKENMVDDGHQKFSAHYAKEILKKIPISYDEKERIYNLILNSHWTTEGKSEEDLGAVFRHSGDLKLARILAEADTKSAGFEYCVDKAEIEAIEANIEKIQSNGIPLFANNLPDDKSKFPADNEGIKYIDFTDKEADISKFGFPEGTKVKDLNLLCHSSSSSLEDLYWICDDSKEICLSSSFMNAEHSIRTFYNHGCDVILHSSNPDIALGGVHVGGTGGKRGFEEFKDYVYMENKCYTEEKYKQQQNERNRKELPDFLRNELNLSDKEYLEFYKQIDNLSDYNDIPDIKLSTGRTLKSDKVKDAFKNMHSYLLKGSEDACDYLNEVVVFQPKIEAVVMNKDSFMNSTSENNPTKKTAKENNIPIILI